ncbi:unnamed protein product, partial [Effrenium voratum]
MASVTSTSPRDRHSQVHRPANRVAQRTFSSPRSLSASRMVMSFPSTSPRAPIPVMMEVPSHVVMGTSTATYAPRWQASSGAHPSAGSAGRLSTGSSCGSRFSGHRLSRSPRDSRNDDSAE